MFYLENPFYALLLELLRFFINVIFCTLCNFLISLKMSSICYEKQKLTFGDYGTLQVVLVLQKKENVYPFPS